MNKFFTRTYFTGYIVTLICLVVEDWQSPSGIFAFLFCVGMDTVIATIWPLYWGILHWR